MSPHRNPAARAGIHPVMPARRTLSLLLALGAVLVPAAPAAALDAPGLRTALGRQSAVLGTASGARVVDLDTGRVLFSRRPDLQLTPASNEKLFTTATALLTLGSAARRATTVVPDGEVEIGAGAGGVEDLYLVGGGDPGLSDAGLADLADQVVRSGVVEVAGGVVGDESLLDARRGSVDSGFAADLDLGGQLGALVVGHGTTDGTGPAHVAAVRLEALLKARGVSFGRRARTGTAPARAGAPVATELSATLAELVRATNQPSDNFYAELLLKVLGAERGGAGSTAAGAAVVRSTLAGIGVRTTAVDGSGLSRANRTTARQVVTLLRAMRSGAEAAAWQSSLPVAGRSGTLRRRMRGTAAATRCAGKTGTLRGVSALSGYCTTTRGRHVVFSFLENGVGYGAKGVEDRMVAALARYSG